MYRILAIAFAVAVALVAVHVIAEGVILSPGMQALAHIAKGGR